MSGHKCPAPACAVTVPPSQFACRGHWYALPKAMRDEIWAEYRREPLSDAHVDAMAAAAAYLRDRYPEEL